MLSTIYTLINIFDSKKIYWCIVWGTRGKLQIVKEAGNCKYLRNTDFTPQKIQNYLAIDQFSSNPQYRLNKLWSLYNNLRMSFSNIENIFLKKKCVIMNKEVWNTSANLHLLKGKCKGDSLLLKFYRFVGQNCLVK